MALVVTIRIPASTDAVECVVEGLVSLNYALMRHAADKLGAAGGGYPPLYESGVRYEREPPGRERWQTAPELLAGGVGDCEDLASYRAAELRLAGEPATVAIVTTSKGSYHAVVRRADGQLEDPSLILLGMVKR